MSLHEGVRTAKHVGDETNTVITTYGNALDVLTQQCQDLISWDTWATVHELNDKADHISANVGNICNVVSDIQQEVWHVLNGVCCVEDAIGHVQNGIDEIENKLSKMGKDGSTQLQLVLSNYPCRSRGHPWPAHLCGECYVCRQESLFGRHEG